jgi:predicted peptidase
MSFKFSISTVAIATFLTLTYGSIASAEVYKTIKGQVVVTGLTAKQKYPVQVVNSKSKSKKLQDKVANTCGVVTVDNATKYKSLVVGTETIDPATLTTKTHARCSGKKNTTATAPTSKKANKTPAASTGMTGTTRTTTGTTPATVTPVPVSIPSTAPTTK